MPARPLLRAAYEFLTGHSDDLTRRIFGPFTPAHLAIEQAAARCGVPLPRHPVEPLGLWQLRVRWSWLGESFHPDLADPDRPAGPNCHTAVPSAPDPAATPPLYRRPYRLRNRWSPLGADPRVVPRLLRAHLDHAWPRIHPA